MIKKLRLKFILIIMIILTLVFILIFASLNMFMKNLFNTDSIMLMKEISRNDGIELKNMPEDRNHNILGTPKTFDIKNMGRHFAVKLNDKNDIIDIIWELPYTISDDTISGLIKSAAVSNKSIGELFGWRYLISEKPYGKLIIFLDNSIEENILSNLRWISFGIGGISLLILFIISFFLSRWAVKPVETAFKKQRQFVSDASHELKTPLTIINANADVLENEIGNNKWLKYIKSECNRMTKLVTDLLYLTKYDNNKNNFVFNKFNLSSAILSTVLPFESVAFEAHKNLSYNIDENIFINGDESKIRQLTVILIDNAIKNSCADGKITITLKSIGSKKVLSVYNTGAGIDNSEKNRIFERFYRSDSSRTRETGGFGLGLAIAKSIVDDHKGRITVKSGKGKYAEFIVTL